MMTDRFHSLALIALGILLVLGPQAYAEGGNPLWQLTQPFPFPGTQVDFPLDLSQQAQISEGQQRIQQARDEYRQALEQNPNDTSLMEHYAWFLYSNGYHDKECLRLLEKSLIRGNAADPGGLFNAIVEVREELGLPVTPLKKPSMPQRITSKPKRTPHPSFKTDRATHGASTGKNVTTPPLEETESFKHWTFTPYYDYSFFNHGRQGWQEEYAQLLYQVNRSLILGAEIDILQRPPSGTDIYYSALASYYLLKELEVHGKISICPDPSFAATQIYTGGFIYQAAPRLGFLLDYQRYNFIQGPIDQINPGLAYNFNDESSIVVRYVRGWAFYNLQYNYYSAALNLGLPGKRKLTMAFAYGTDPDAQIGADGSTDTSLSPAYTYSLFFTQPITRDLTLFTGIQYVYRLRESGGELYQQLTPTIGCSLKF